MSATDYVAIYAAVIATGGLCWQVWTHFALRRPKIRMEIRHAAQPADDSDLAGQLIYEITVAAVNFGETTETVEAIGVHWPDQQCGIDDRPIRERLEPGDVVKRSFQLIACDFDPTRGIVPFVEIASSQNRISGEPAELEEYLLDVCWPV
jgi:hypothetical protein